VAGNADDEVLSANEPRTYPSEFLLKLHDIDRWSLSKLGPEDVDFIRSFHSIVEIPLGQGGRTMLCVHGSPRSNREGMFPTTPEQDLAKMLSGVTASIVACGHTHSQLFRRYIQSKIIINPGSVGLPFDFDTIEKFTQRDAYNPAYAEYAIVDYVRDALFDVELHRCPVDLQELTNSYLTSGMPHAQLFSKDWREVS
jgi:predicted phosphodiesterase